MTNREEVIATELKALLEKSDQRQSIVYALKALFPKMSKLLEPGYSFNSQLYPARNRRISHPNFARYYLQLSPSEHLWSKSKIENALKNGNADHVFSVLHEHINSSEDDRLIRNLFIDTVTDFITEANSDGEKWFKSTITHSDLLIGDEEPSQVPFFGLSLFSRVRILLLRTLERVDAGKRIDLFRSEANSSDNLSLLCNVFRSIAGDAVSDGAAPSFSLEGWHAQHTLELRTFLVELLRIRSQSPTFWSQRDIPDLLWFWRNANCIDEVRDFTTKAMDTVVGLSALLNATVSYVHSSAGNFERVNHASWSKLLDMNKLEERAKMLLAQGNDSERALAQRFLDALVRGKDDEF